MVRCVGIRVQLEAQCTLKFETKLDGRVSFHKKYDNILECSEERDPCNLYQKSPVMTDVVPFTGTFLTDIFFLYFLRFLPLAIILFPFFFRH